MKKVQNRFTASRLAFIALRLLLLPILCLLCFGADYPLSIASSSTCLSPLPDWTAEGNQPEAYFGWAVSTAGDINGDGYDDVLVGSWEYDNGHTDEGAAFLFLGSASGVVSTPAWTAEGNQSDSCFGYSVSTAGDVNGDGFDDVIVGAFSYGVTGRAFVYYGSAVGLSTSPDWVADGNPGDGLGNSVANAGDVNGDGYDDIIIGASYYDNDQLSEGCAHVFHGSASGLSLTPDWTAEGNQADVHFGYHVSTAGDVNGDGYDDVIISAPSYDNDQDSEGKASVFLGSASGLASTATWTVEGNETLCHLGRSISTAGDVNGDGFDEVIVGSYGYQHWEGRQQVFYGSASGLSSVADWTAEGIQEMAMFGFASFTAGDVNGDGYDDVIVGAYGYDNGEFGEGRAFVYCGFACGLLHVAHWTAECNQSGGALGQSVSTAGDVNGDGYDDVIVGAPWYDNGETDEGRAYVFHGSATLTGVNSPWSCYR